MTDVPHNQGVDPNTFAASARTLLLEDRGNWRNFGVYWFLVKALLRKRYPPQELPLGTHQDESVIERMPFATDLPHLLELAGEEYAFNATLGAGRTTYEDPDGEHFMLIDPDMGP